MAIEQCIVPYKIEFYPCGDDHGVMLFYLNDSDYVYVKGLNGNSTVDELLSFCKKENHKYWNKILKRKK